MYLKGELNKRILQMQNNIEDYQNILQNPDVQRLAHMKSLAKENLERYEKRLEMYNQCLRIYQFMEENYDKELIKNILEG